MVVADTSATDPSGRVRRTDWETSVMWPDSITLWRAFSSRYLIASMRTFRSGLLRAKSTRVSTHCSGVQAAS
jgi:hypothetical protein